MRSEKNRRKEISYLRRQKDAAEDNKKKNVLSNAIYHRLLEAQEAGSRISNKQEVISYIKESKKNLNEGQMEKLVYAVTNILRLDVLDSETIHLYSRLALVEGLIRINLDDILDFLEGSVKKGESEKDALKIQKNALSFEEDIKKVLDINPTYIPMEEFESAVKPLHIGISELTA